MSAVPSQLVLGPTFPLSNLVRHRLKTFNLLHPNMGNPFDYVKTVIDKTVQAQQKKRGKKTTKEGRKKDCEEGRRLHQRSVRGSVYFRVAKISSKYIEASIFILIGVQCLSWTWGTGNFRKFTAVKPLDRPQRNWGSVNSSFPGNFPPFSQLLT